MLRRTHRVMVLLCLVLIKGKTVTRQMIPLDNRVWIPRRMGTPHKFGSSTKSAPKPSNASFSGGKTALSEALVQEFGSSKTNNASFLQEQIDASMEGVKEDLMAWMGIYKGDQENCFDLLRHMKFVDEERVIGYDYCTPR